MKSASKTIAIVSTFIFTSCFVSCSDNLDDQPIQDNVQTTSLMTVAINTETLASEQEQQVVELADSLTGELENKTVKWMSFYDPWHPTGTGNSKPVAVELFEKKYGGEIVYYPTTWENQYNDLSINILGGEGIDFFPATEAIPKCVKIGRAHV